MFSAMKDLEPQERKAFGQLMNALKVTAEARLKEAQGDQGSNGKGVEKETILHQVSPTNLAHATLLNRPKIE